MENLIRFCWENDQLHAGSVDWNNGNVKIGSWKLSTLREAIYNHFKSKFNTTLESV